MGVKSAFIALVTGSVLVVGGGVAAASLIEPPGPDRAKVVKVVDGDTLDVKYDGETHRIRLLNVDAPETKHPGKAVECLGPEATAYLEQQLEPGDVVRLEFDVERLDRYDRELAGVWQGEVLINAEIARHGLGVPVIFEPNRKFYPPVAEAYEEAKANGVGIFDPQQTCTFPARVEAYAALVAEVEAQSGQPEQAVAAADSAVAEGAALVALIGGVEATSLSAAGLTAAELDAMREQVVALQERARVVGEGAQEAIEQAEAERKAEEDRRKAEARKKAEEKRKAEEARQEAERKAEEERQAAEAERRAEEERRAEAQRRAEEERAQQAPIQPLMPQPAPQPAPPPQPAPVPFVFKNCTEARAAGAAPVYRGQPGYGPHLDRDNDGIGCE